MKSEVEVSYKQYYFLVYSSYGIPIVISLMIHIGMFGLLLINWDNPSVTQHIPMVHMKARMVAPVKFKENSLKIDDRTRKSAELAARIKELDRQRKQEVIIARKKEVERKKDIALKKSQEAERKRMLAQKKEIQEAKKKLKEQLERDKEQKQQRMREKEELIKKLANERLLLDQKEMSSMQEEKDNSEVAYYSNILINRMIQFWNRPPVSRNDMETIIEAELSSFGDLIMLKIIKGSGNDAFDRSVVQAVKLGTPVKELKQLERRIFEKYFKNFRFKFSPGDLVR